MKQSTRPRFAGMPFEISLKVDALQNSCESVKGLPVTVQIPKSIDLEISGGDSITMKVGETITLVATPRRATLPGYPINAFFALKINETQVKCRRLSLYVFPNPLNIAIAGVTAVSAIFQQIGPGPITLGSIIAATGGGYSILRLLSWALKTQQT